MANKHRFTVDEVVTALAASRGMISPAARALRCDQQTVRNYAARFPKVQQAIDDQRERFVDTAELRLIDAVQRGDLRAIMYVLSRLGKDRGYVERIEQTGKDGGPQEYRQTVIILPAEDAKPDPGTPPD